MSTTPINGEFKEYRRLILSELERLNKKLEDQASTLVRIEKDITSLQTRAGFAGAVAGAVLAAAVSFVFRGAK